MSSIEIPFQIGDTYWRARTSPVQETVPCPVCAGGKVVTVCAQAETFTVACDACGLGYHGPQGVVREYTSEPHASPFVIAEVVGMRDGEWAVRSQDGEQELFHSLFATEHEALAASQKRCTELMENNMASRRYKRKGVSKATWTVRYHTDAIKKLERELAYHRSKIGKSATTQEDSSR